MWLVFYKFYVLGFPYCCCFSNICTEILLHIFNILDFWFMYFVMGYSIWYLNCVCLCVHYNTNMCFSYKRQEITNSSTNLCMHFSQLGSTWFRTFFLRLSTLYILSTFWLLTLIRTKKSWKSLLSNLQTLGCLFLMH